MPTQQDSTDPGAGGAFGHWTTDRAGLPAYEYTCDQARDPRAATFTTCGPSRLHWHQIGNDTFNAICSNRGEVQVLESSRGLQWLTYCDASRLCPGGGIALVQRGQEAWTDLYVPGAPAAGYRRIFGAGYFRKILIRNGLRTDHRIIAPFGRAPVLFCELLITNTAPVIVTATVSEFFGVRLHYLAADMLVMPADRTRFGVSPLEQMPANLLRAARAASRTDTDSLRRRHGDRFHFTTHYDTEHRCLIQTPQYTGARKPEPKARADRNYYPDSMFLARLDTPHPEAEMHFGDTRRVLQKHPRLFETQGLDPAAGSARRAAPCLALGETLVLAPGETRRLVFAAGYAPAGRVPDLVHGAQNHALRRGPEDLLARESAKWSKQLAFFNADNIEDKEQTAWLARETPWHASYTRGAALFDSYFETRYLPQGGAYEYLHGLRGAVRDLCFFAVPMVYLDPGLARDILLFCLRLQTPDGRLMYTNYNYGQCSGALVHNHPTDLHLFLLWAITEYVFFTRDFDFLSQTVPFYPKHKRRSSAVSERISLSLDYLINTIGTGPHGLLRVGDGDWSDGISLFVRDRGAFVKRGESAFNTAMALYVLPRMADLLKIDDPARAADLDRRTAALRAATLASWTGRWFPRGYDGRGRAFGVNHLFLEHHAWLLVSDCLPDDKKQQTLHHIRTLLDDPAPFGQMILHPPADTALGFHEKGWDVNGGIWYAINFLLAWGYSKSDPDLGWAALRKNSCAHRARTCPDIWYGLWSGPDAYNAHYSPRPGQTYFHLPTPATDFPVMNLNLHACFLLALIKICGIEPGAHALRLSPRVPLDRWSFTTPCLSLQAEPDTVRLSIKKPLPEPKSAILDPAAAPGKNLVVEWE